MVWYHDLYERTRRMFLIIAGVVMLAFGLMFPRTYQFLYWLCMLPIFTLGPGSFFFLISSLFGFGVPMSACLVFSFCCVAVPFCYFTTVSSQ